MKRLASLAVLLCLVAVMTGCCCMHCGQPMAAKSCRRMMKQGCGAGCNGFACGGPMFDGGSCGGCGVAGEMGGMGMMGPGGEMMMNAPSGGGCASGNCGGTTYSEGMTGNMNYEGTGWVPSGSAWSTNMTPMPAPGNTPTPATGAPAGISPATPRAN